jgi:hypothetical protein
MLSYEERTKIHSFLSVGFTTDQIHLGIRPAVYSEMCSASTVPVTPRRNGCGQSPD